MQKRRITARGIIFKQGKLFAQKLKSPDGERSYWCTPGGGLEPNESIIECLHREILEETGIKPQIGHLVLVQQYYEGETEFLEFFFQIKNASDYENVNLSETSHGELEVSQAKFVDPKAELILPKKLSKIDFSNHLQMPREVIFYHEQAII